MEQQLVPPEEWRGFTDDFSRLHEGQQVTIVVVDAQGGSQHIAQNLPLMGMTIDPAGTRPSSIEIAVGGDRLVVAKLRNMNRVAAAY